MIRGFSPAPIRKTIWVDAEPQVAFEVFAIRMHAWWPNSHTIGRGELQQAVIEPRVGGRWYGLDVDGAETEWGEVLEWRPPERLALAWRIGADHRFDRDLETEVHVTFHRVDGGTEVRLEHRHLERMGAQVERARNQLDGPEGWAVILERFAAVFPRRRQRQA